LSTFGEVELSHLSVVVHVASALIVHVGILVVDTITEELILLVQCVLYLVSCDLLVMSFLLVARHAKTTAISHLL
jgi:hypothetical protein